MAPQICEKCNYEFSQEEKPFKKFGLSFCSLCFLLSPNTPEKLDFFIQEKLPAPSTENLQALASSKLNEQPQKKAMLQKAANGNSMSRPPFGYLSESGKLVPAQNFKEVEEIFEDFLNNKISLRNLSEKHNLSVNGLKKILRNFTYIGKIKFNSQIHQGTHPQ